MPAKPPPLRPPPLPVDLELEPFAVVDREGDTEREGMLKDPRDLLISSLQQELFTLKLLQRAQPISEPPPASEPVPETRPSQLVLRKQRAARVTRWLGKWGALIGLLPLAGGVVTKLWPDYADLVELVLAAVGAR